MAAPKSGPKAPILLDESQLEKLAAMGCTLNEIAAFFGCSVDTVTRNYADALYKGRENGKVSIRRMMWEQGQRGNSTALKYLVHNILKEKIEDYAKQEDSNSGEILDKLSSISTDMILKLVKDHSEKAS